MKRPNVSFSLHYYSTIAVYISKINTYLRRTAHGCTTDLNFIKTPDSDLGFD